MFRARRRFQSFRFPYQFIQIDIGKIPYPVVPVVTANGKKLLKYDFIVDTGADVTTLPKYIAEELGIDLSKLQSGNSQGIGEGLIKTWETKVKIRIGNVDFRIRCSFVSSNKIPPLLGKIDIFDRFNLYFDNDKEELVLTRR